MRREHSADCLRRKRETPAGVSTKIARQMVTNLTEIAVRETKKKGVFVLPGIGRLVRQERKARMGRNPATGEAIKIAASKTEVYVDRSLELEPAQRQGLNPGHAGLRASGPVIVREPVPTRDHSEIMLRQFGCEVVNSADGVALGTRRALRGQRIAIAADPSSAAFSFTAAAIVPGGAVEVRGMLVNPLRIGRKPALMLPIGALIRIEVRELPACRGAHERHRIPPQPRRPSDAYRRRRRSPLHEGLGRRPPARCCSTRPGRTRSSDRCRTVPALRRGRCALSSGKDRAAAPPPISRRRTRWCRSTAWRRKATRRRANMSS